MKVTVKGQVTIPRDIRRRFGMEPGTRVEFVARGNEVIVQPLEDAERELRRAIERVRGSATSGLRTDEILRMTRGDR